MASKAARTPNKDLERFYELGKLVLEEGANSLNPQTGRLARGAFARICKQKRRNHNELSKARRFARLYDRAELRTLCALGSREGQQQITKSHVCRLVVVDDGTLRRRLARDCAKYCWSVQRLEIEIQRVQNKRKYGGRTPKRPESRDELLGETERLANRLIHWVGVLKKVNHAARLKRASNNRRSKRAQIQEKAITINILPAPLRTQLLSISDEAEKLSVELRRRLERRSRRRKRRGKRV